MNITGIVIDSDDYNNIKLTINRLRTILNFDTTKLSNEEITKVRMTILKNINIIDQIIKQY